MFFAVVLVPDTRYLVPVALQGGNLRAKQKISARTLCHFMQAFGNLPKAPLGIIKAPRARRLQSGHRRSNFANHLRERTRGYSPPRLRDGKLLRRHPPQLSGMREIEIPANRST